MTALIIGGLLLIVAFNGGLLARILWLEWRRVR